MYGKGNHATETESLIVNPYGGNEFSFYQDDYNFYNAYAKLRDFGICKYYSELSRKKDVIIFRTFMCDKEGFKYMKYKRRKMCLIRLTQGVGYKENDDDQS